MSMTIYSVFCGWIFKNFVLLWIYTIFTFFPDFRTKRLVSIKYKPMMLWLLSPKWGYNLLCTGSITIIPHGSFINTGLGLKPRAGSWMKKGSNWKCWLSKNRNKSRKGWFKDLEETNVLGPFICFQFEGSFWSLSVFKTEFEQHFYL